MFLGAETFFSILCKVTIFIEYFAPTIHFFLCLEITFLCKKPYVGMVTNKSRPVNYRVIGFRLFFRFFID